MGGGVENGALEPTLGEFFSETRIVCCKHPSCRGVLELGKSVQGVWYIMSPLWYTKYTAAVSVAHEGEGGEKCFVFVFTHVFSC